MASKNKKTPAKTASKGNSSLILVAAVAVIVCLAVVLFTNGNAAKQETPDASDASVREIENAKVIASGESLEIPTADITTDASFFPVEVDGTTMEVIAVRDSSGEIRTAFNTCQICYSSGRGYYVQSGDYLVCQNCGNHYSMDQVGIEAGGCNPWPIFDSDKTVTDDVISISYDFLDASKQIFARWKTNG